MTTVEFDCVDCGQHIYAVGIDVVPDDRVCAICRWLDENVDDKTEREAMRERLRPKLH